MTYRVSRRKRELWRMWAGRLDRNPGAMQWVRTAGPTHEGPGSQGETNTVPSEAPTWRRALAGRKRKKTFL